MDNAMSLNSLENYCQRWKLDRPALLVRTFTSEIYKVEIGNKNAVLKVFNDKGKKFENKGAAVLRCLNGVGAALLLNADDGAHLLEFIDGSPLKTLVEQGSDDQATEVICDTLKKIHSYSGPIPGELISMERNFRSLFEKAREDSADAICKKGAEAARSLIASAREVRVLHGDVHHENIMKHPIRGVVH